MADHAPQYDPFCLACRRASGSPDAGVTTECRWHQVDRLTRERDEAVREFELQKRSLAALVGDLEQTVAERDTLRALLREVAQAELLCGTLGEYIDVQMPTSVWLKVKAALEGRDG